MTRAEIRDLYRERRAERSEEKKRGEGSLALTAYARLTTFAAGVVVAWFVWETELVSWPWLALPAGAFGGLVVLHGRLEGAYRRSERAERFYERGLARLEERWSGTGDFGDRFLREKHPYARDLDIFGKGSIFELLATTGSPWGSARLARWLQTPASPAVIRERQEAVTELAPLLELREMLASELEPPEQDMDDEALARWASAPVVLRSPLARWLALGLGLLNAAAIVAWLASWVSRVPVMVLLAASGGFALWWRPRVRDVLASVERPARGLQMLAALLERFERQSFKASLLVRLQERFLGGREPSSTRIRGLVRRIDFLDARRNQLFAPVAAVLLWATQFAFALESWRRLTGPDVSRWLEAVGELDALMALATFRFEHPDDPFPEIVEDRALFDAEQIGHPLIPEERLVRNDVRFGEEIRLIVVSGSNMSGKSTLLRTIGVSAVLAQTGCPVRARKLVLSPFTVAASIRILDSLQEGISHFYAEILRLRQVTELASSERTLLFLLDEILHGTNSHDRRIGAEAVVRNLVERGAVGLITTHDLALSRLAEALDGRAINVHFEDQIVDGKVRFDYRMRPGVVTKSNALELMRSVGLEV